MKQKLLLFSLLVVLVSCSKQESMDEMIDRVDTGGSLEHLDDDDLSGGVQYLSPPHGAVRHPDADHLLVTDGLGVLDVHQGSGDLGDRLVLFGNVCHWNHTPSSANCLSMSSATAFSSSSMVFSYLAWLNLVFTGR